MIKPAGILFYNSWNQSKIQEKANILSRRNIIATLILAIASLLISVYGVFKDFNDKKLQKINQHIPINLQRKEKSQQLNQSNQRSNYLNLSGKH